MWRKMMRGCEAPASFGRDDEILLAQRRNLPRTTRARSVHAISEMMIVMAK